MIAGGGVRAVLELAGIRDVLAKSLGTTNPINMAQATVDGLKRLRRPEDVARSRGKSITEVLPYRPAGRAGSATNEAGAEPVASRAEEPQDGGDGMTTRPRHPGAGATSASPTATRARSARSVSARSARAPSTGRARSSRGMLRHVAHLVT